MVLVRPGLLLRVEGGVLLAAALFAYWRLEGNWIHFVVLLLAPDIGLVGYLRGPRLGAALYNLTHAEVLPVALAFVGVLGESPIALQLAAIWLAHVGMDRVIGYGLKFPTGFKDTHLSRLGL